MALPLTRPRSQPILRGFASVHGRRLETATIMPPDPVRPRAPYLVFLHGAFGSLAAWEHFPRDVARASGCPVLVYSRAGHGNSDPPAESGADYLQVEAQSVLPALLDLQGIERPVLVGHEDGAAIALIHAGSGFDVAGIVALAPRSAIGEPAASAVQQAHARLAAGEAMQEFTRHHRDPLALLERWATLWASPGLRARTLEPFLRNVAAPVVLVQGEDDEHASLADLASLARDLHGCAQSIQLETVGHTPWHDAPRAIAATITALVDRVR